MNQDWKAVSPEDASTLLFFRFVELMLCNQSYNISADLTIRVLTQRLYGDYRQASNTSEYKRAEKYVYIFKNSGLGKELF